MQHMDNVKQKMIYLFYLMSIIIYISYRLYDDSFYSNRLTEYTQNKLNNYLNKRNKIDGIIYGGSNAVMGISAEKLSNYSGKNYYNLSLMSEGGDQFDYFDYLKKSIPDSVKNKITLVVYSTIHLYDKNIKKKIISPNTSILPSKSMATIIFNYLNIRKTPEINVYPFNSTEYGDFPFNENYAFKDLKSKFTYDYNETIIQIIQIEKQKTKKLFPNAKFILVGPPLLNSNYYKQQIYFMKKLSKALDKNCILYVLEDPQTKFQPIWYDNEHLNAIGRDIRSKQLYHTLKQKYQF